MLSILILLIGIVLIAVLATLGEHKQLTCLSKREICDELDAINIRLIQIGEVKFYFGRDKNAHDTLLKEFDRLLNRKSNLIKQLNYV